MGLVYKWYPSPSYSPGAIGNNPRLLVCHTTEGATTNDSIKNFLCGHNGVSYHASVDNYMDNVCYEYVYESDGAWAQCSYNDEAVCCVFCTPSGASNSWSSSYWQNEQSRMMHNMAKWLADQSKQYGIPLVELTSSQAQGGGRGVCQHKNLGSGGCSHSDCGNMPMAHLLNLAKNYAGGGGGESEKPPDTIGIDVSISPIACEQEDIMGQVKSGEKHYAPVPRGATAIRIASDVSGQGTSEIKVRLAMHDIGTTGWPVTHVVLTASAPRADVKTTDRDCTFLQCENGDFQFGYTFI